MALTIGTTVQLNVAQDKQATYDWIADVDAPIKFMNRHGPVPGFESHTLRRGDWKHQGDQRQIVLDGGTTALETIKIRQRPDCFEYELTELANTSRLSRLLLNHSYSRCQFTTRPGGGTRISWRFTFQAQNLLLAPLLWLFVHIFYRRYMQAAAREVERLAVTEGFS